MRPRIAGTGRQIRNRAERNGQFIQGNYPKCLGNKNPGVGLFPAGGDDMGRGTRGGRDATLPMQSGGAPVWTAGWTACRG
jgi:hypothetical protein